MLLSLFKSRTGATVAVTVGVVASVAVGTVTATGTSQHGTAQPAGVAATATVGTVTAQGTGAAIVGPTGAGAPWRQPLPVVLPVSVRIEVEGLVAVAQLGRVQAEGSVDDALWRPVADAVRDLVARYDEHDALLREISVTLHALVNKR
jgi:hypothetical protein